MTMPESASAVEGGPTGLLLDLPLNDVEIELVELYRATKRLLRRDDLAPCVRANLVASAASLNQVVNDLGLVWEYLYDLEGWQ